MATARFHLKKVSLKNCLAAYSIVRGMTVRSQKLTTLASLSLSVRAVTKLIVRPHNKILNGTSSMSMSPATTWGITKRSTNN